MELTDSATVEALQLRAPSASTEDAAFINNGMTSRKLWPFITDSAVREKIRLNVLSTQGLIPTLWSYREDTKYLEPCVNAMKLLVDVGPTETLRKAFFRIYTDKNIKRGSYLQQDDEHKVVKVIDDRADRFQFHYIQLFLYCARHFLRMVNVACRKDVDEHKPIIREPSAKIIYRFAVLARNFGFDSPQIQQLMSSDPTTQVVFDSLVRLESDEDDFDEKSLRDEAHQIVKFRQKQRRKQPHATRKKPCLTSDTVDQSLAERCGRAFDKAQKDDKKFLFLRWVSADLDSRGRYITSFYVKRSILLSFLGGKYTFKSLEESVSADFIDELGGAGFSTQEDGRCEEQILRRPSPLLEHQSAQETSEQAPQQDAIVFDRALIPVSYTGIL